MARFREALAPLSRAGSDRDDGPAAQEAEPLQGQATARAVRSALEISELPLAADAAAQGRDRRLGDILSRRLAWPAQEADRVAAVARLRGVRYGDAAVAMGLASPQDVFRALSSQFRYACMDAGRGDHAAEQVMLRRPRSAQAEALRALRSELSRLVFRDGGQAASLAVISPQSQDGKSFLSANLAVAWSQAGRRTLLIDADLRGPRQHEVFGLGACAGLSTLLSGRASLEVISAVEEVPGLYVLPAGPLPPNPAELVDGPVFRDLMAELAGRFDQVVVDTPACAYGADALAIADRCTAALVVARQHASRLASLGMLASRLSQGPSRLAGVVVNTF